MNNSASGTVKPNYMHKFQCIGSACEDSCCAGWRVVFDKRTAQSYLDAKDPEIHEIANRAIKKVKTDRSSQNHSFIQMDPQTAACPFLQTDKLCMIQGRMGENALSKVCSTYPRHGGGVAGQRIEVATLSCPEAARLCLLDPDAMKLGANKISLADQLSFTAAPPKLSAIQYLHQSALEMLEDDRVSIIEFVLVYGAALSMLRSNPEQAFQQDRRFAETQGIITLVRKGLEDTQTNAFQSREAVQFQLGKVLPILVRHARNNLLKNQRFLKSVFDALNGVNLDPTDLQKSVDRYVGAIAKLSQTDQLILSLGFRNYLINDLLKNAGRYMKSPNDALGSLQDAIVRLSLVAVQVIGARALYPDCKIEERLTLAVSSTARAFEHKSAVMMEIITYLDNIEEKSVAVLGLITPRLE
jgi:lysine-N-methylase